MRNLVTTVLILGTAIFLNRDARSQIVIIEKTPFFAGKAADLGPPAVAAVPVRCLPEGQVFIGPSKFKWRLVLTVGSILPDGRFQSFPDSSVAKLSIDTPTPPTGFRWRSPHLLDVKPAWAGDLYCQAETQVSLFGDIWFSRLDVHQIDSFARQLGVPAAVGASLTAHCPQWAVFDKNGSRAAHRELK